MSRKVLITGATGDTGRAAVRESLALGLDVRDSLDSRSETLKILGAEVVVGDLLEINTIRALPFLRQDVLRVPAGKGRHSPIAADDQGRAVAALLKDPDRRFAEENDV
jgi:uncharacterized protein YbjT (DUF2867 family)